MRYLVLLLSLYLGDLSAQQDPSLFVLGHSLVDYRPDSSYSDEYALPHWLEVFSDAGGSTFQGGGKYGFLPQHKNYSQWFAQWGYDIVDPSWDSDNETFVQSSVNTLMWTAGNFLQNDMQPDDNYYMSSFSPLSCSQAIVDTVNMNKPGLKYYIYENWPEMNSMLSNGFPPTPAEEVAYNTYTQTAFHQWWIDYHDMLLASHGPDSIKMIPVGPIMGRLFNDTLLTNIPATACYIDGDPHGTPSLYFLASMITYQAIYGEPCPTNVSIPNTIHPDIVTSYSAVNTYIWDQLQTYVDANGVSRVFFGESNNPVAAASAAARLDGGALYVESPDGIILKAPNGTCYQITIGNDGVLRTTMVACP